MKSDSDLLEYILNNWVSFTEDCPFGCSDYNMTDDEMYGILECEKMCGEILTSECWRKYFSVLIDKENEQV